MCSPKTTTRFPIVDLSGLNMSKAGTEAWVVARAKVIEALDTVGFFTVVFDDISREFLDELCGPVMKSLFSIPAQLRARMAYEKSASLKKHVAPNYDSVVIDDAQSPDTVRALTDVLWPQVPSYSDKVWIMTTQMAEVELMVRRMILESIGVGEHFSSTVDSIKQVAMIAEYGAPLDQDTMLCMPRHRDPCLMTLIYQNETEGLELLTKSGDRLLASPNTFTIITGASFSAWSNGRIQPAEHGVIMTGNDTRYSFALCSQFRDGCKVVVPTELVTDENPMPLNTFEYLSYLKFIFTEQGNKAIDPVKAYLGLNVDEAKV